MTFGGQADAAASAEILKVALDAGINFIDTANAYNKGESETILGGLLKGGIRKKVVLASKVFNRMGPGADDQGLSKEAILKAVEDSLRRLGTDYLDIYYLHQPDWNTPLESSLEAMESLVKQGKVRYPASSNYAAWQVVQMQEIAGRRRFKPAVITQPMFNLIARGLDQEYFAMCRQYRIGTIVYNPLAGGLLTGKHRREQPAAGTRFDRNQMYLDRYWHEDMFDAVDALVDLAQHEDRTPVSLSLNWLLHHTPADCVILGASSERQLSDNLTSLYDGPLSENAVRTVDVIWDALRGPTPKYNR